MKAYAFAETYSRTAHRPGPTIFYTLEYTPLSAIVGGVGTVTTMDRHQFEAIVREAAQQGVEVVTSRLPWFSRREGVRAINEETSEPLTARVRRVPLDEAA